MKYAEDGVFEKIQAHLDQAGCLVDLTNLSSTDLEKMYKYATQLYDQKKYRAALPLFVNLNMLEDLNFDYSFALGLCLVKLEEYSAAIFEFARLSVMKLDDPRPTYYLGVCFEATQEPERAKTMYELAADCSRRDATWQLFYEAAVEALKRYNSNLSEQEKG